MIVNPGEGSHEKGERVDVTCSDHPLSVNPDSQWGTYFKDNEVLLQIDKDVRYGKEYFYLFITRIILSIKFRPLPH